MLESSVLMNGCTEGYEIWKTAGNPSNVGVCWAIKKKIVLIFNSCGVTNLTNPMCPVKPLCTLTKAASVHMQPMAAAPESADQLLVVKAIDRG